MTRGSGQAPLVGANSARAGIRWRVVRWIGAGVALLTGFNRFVYAAYAMQCISNRYRAARFCRVMPNSKSFPRWTTMEVDYWTYMIPAIVLLGLGIGLAVAPWIGRKLRRLLGFSGQV